MHTGQGLEQCPIMAAHREWVQFQAPEGVFFPERRIRFEVVNTIGQGAVFHAAFVAQEYRVIEDSHRYFNYYSPNIFCPKPQCCTRDVSYFRERHWTAFQNKQLINDWMVVNDAEVEVTRCDCASINDIDLPSRLCQTRIIGPPVIRSNNPETRLKIRFKPDGVSFTTRVTIVGPEGLPHFPE